MADDVYHTIKKAADTIYKERSSKFLCYAYPVCNEVQIKSHLDELRKRYYDATHHCYAWRLGQRGEFTRVNDDGEPSSTAGKPILGQILSKELTEILIVVVRYFGGTKLGVGGLITAYKASAAAVIEECEIVERTIDKEFELEFPYNEINEVMRVVKELEPTILTQEFDNICTMKLSIRESKAEHLAGRIEKYIVEERDK